MRFVGTAVVAPELNKGPSLLLGAPRYCLAADIAHIAGVPLRSPASLMCRSEASSSVSLKRKKRLGVLLSLAESPTTWYGTDRRSSLCPGI